MKPSLPTADQWPEISRLLDVAMALPRAQRAAWLAGLAAADVAQRDALVGLLSTLADIEDDDFLAELPRLEVEDATHELTAGQTIGCYRLVSEIGVGGMGTVWLAERADGLAQRRIALKLPRAVWGGSFAERLTRESRILATLEHQHIARLYDAGLDAQGRPFLALEFVEGQPIDVFCRERALPLREREGLLLQTMSAVAHAHARLVVHRDLKPANILVTRDGQVKLLDFGIAKLLESDLTADTALTRVGGRALSLDYASPEQIRGAPLGTASDVYSLGVVAYELLSEARPYRLHRGSAAEMEEAIATAEPSLASDATTSPVLRKALRGDLDAILNRALKKSVGERYPSVEAFAQELERHLRGEPVQARPDSRRYRAAKFVRRHRSAVALASTLAASIVVGSGISVWQAVVAHRQEQRALSENERQQAVRDLYDETMMALSVTATEHPEAFSQPHVITQALQDKLHELEPRFHDRPVERAAQLEAVMLQLNYDDEFEASLAIGREYLAHLKANDGTADQIITVYAVMGRDLAQLKRYDECEAMRRAGLEWSPGVDDSSTRLSRLQIASDLGNVLVNQGKRAQAFKVLMQAEAIAAQEPLRNASRYENGFTLANYYGGFDDMRELQAAQASHDGMQTVTTQSPDERASYLRYYGVALVDNGHAAQAESVFRESEALYRQAYGRSSRNAVVSAMRTADSISRQGDYARAEQMLSDETRALSASREGLPPYAGRRLLERRLENGWLAGDTAGLAALPVPDVSELAEPKMLRENLALLLYLARAQVMTGLGSNALATMQTVRRNWPDPDHATNAWTHILALLAQAQLAAGQAQHARATAGELVALFEREQAQAGRTAVDAAELDALAAARLGDTRAAADALARADRARPPPPFASAVEHAESLLRRAEILAALGRSADAATAGRDAVALLNNQNPDSPRLARARRFADGTAATQGLAS